MLELFGILLKISLKPVRCCGRQKGRRKARKEDLAAAQTHREATRIGDTITSFFFVHADGSTPISYEAGQYLPIRLSVPGEKSPVVRTYTLSDMSNAKAYRISVKREARKLCEQ